MKIYKITNLITDECYIGQTRKALEVRFKGHIVSSDCPKLHEALIEYGSRNFKIELLEECEDNVANNRESYYIDLLNTIEKGYNCMYSDPSYYKKESKRKRTSKEKVKNVNLSNNRYFLNFSDLEEAFLYFEEHKESILTDERLYKKNWS